MIKPRHLRYSTILQITQQKIVPTKIKKRSSAVHSWPLQVYWQVAGAAPAEAFTTRPSMCRVSGQVVLKMPPTQIEVSASHSRTTQEPLRAPSS